MPAKLHVMFVCLPQDDVDVLCGILQSDGFDVCSEQAGSVQQLHDLLSDHLQILLVDSLSEQPRVVRDIHAVLTRKALDIPVLVYSRAGDEDMIVAAMKAGAQDFINSGSPQRVLTAVRRELAAAQQRAVTRRQARMDALLQETDGLMLRGWDVEPIATRICQQVVLLSGLKLGWIGGKQPDGSVGVVAASGDVDYLQDIQVRWDGSPLATGPVGSAIVKKKPVVMRLDHPAFAPWRKAARRHGIKSVLALPMLARDEVIGVLAMYSARRDAFDAASVRCYAAFANRLAITLLVAQEHQQFRLLNFAVSKATQAIFITREDGAIIWFNQALSDISGYTHQEILDSTPHMFSSGTYDKSHWESMWHDILQGKTWTGDILNRRKDGSLYNVLQSITPLYNSLGEVAHFLCVQQDVSEKKELERKIEYLAYHDVLTGLPNRTLFGDRMQQAISQAKRDQTEFSLLFVDLDGFKEINDNYGHAAGDQLLKIVAERLRACVREGDTVARMGGDEFMVLLRDVATEAGLRAVAHKIIEQAARPYELDVCRACITASIGISRYPQDALLAEKLIRYADEAMYTAKHAGKNRYALWRTPVRPVEISDWQI